MKLLIVSFYYPPEMGAASSRISNMAEGLQQKGNEVEVLTCLPNYPKGEIFDGYKGCISKKEYINGVLVHRYWTYATVSRNKLTRLLGMMGFSIFTWWFGFKFRRIRQYDKVIIQCPPMPVAFSALLLFRCIYRKNTVLNVSDLWPLSGVELGAIKEGSAYYKVLAWMEQFIYRKAVCYQGQSQEILDHIQSFGHKQPHFLYRNLQPKTSSSAQPPASREPIKLVYAGLLGIAQDILGMIKAINFKEIGAELHIYGGGNQAGDISEYIKNHDHGVVFYGYKTKEEINRKLGTYHASIVPLTVFIKGAVPSKIFDLLPHGTPILFCGGGEGEKIVSDYQLGMTSAPGNYEALKENIIKMKEMDEQQYLHLRENCHKASLGDFSFDEQMDRYFKFLKEES